MLKQIINEYIFIPVAHASGPADFTALLARINEHVINPLLIVLFSLAFVQFTIGLFKFFRSKSGGDSGDSIEQGKSHMLWGIVGMAIMVSVFGIMSLMTSTLGVDNVGSNIQKGTGGGGDISGLFR